MFGIKAARSSARRGVFRLAVSATLALWCVVALANGDARALCLDLGGNCSPSAAVPEGPCHDQEPSGAGPECDSCVDVLVHEDATASGNRPEHELQTPVTAHPSGFGSQALLATADLPTATAISLNGSLSPHTYLRIAVLRI